MKLFEKCSFAAEVFHGLQEQVMTTASRSHRLMVRVQNIEASLPALEKAVLAQTSHIHLAYTAGMVILAMIPNYVVTGNSVFFILNMLISFLKVIALENRVFVFCLMGFTFTKYI